MRKCDGCTLCCEIVPVEEIGKPVNTLCAHQTSNSCAIYNNRPLSCRLWSCRWLQDEEDTANLDRPDTSHYVIDIMLDEIQALQEGDSKPLTMKVIQIWIDPKFPDAHKDQKLRAYLEDKWRKERLLGLIRYGTHFAITLLPPETNREGVWIEKEGVCK